MWRIPLMRTKDDPERSMRLGIRTLRAPLARPPRVCTTPRRIGRNKCSQAVVSPTVLPPISIRRSYPASSSLTKSQSQKRPLVLIGGSKSGQRSRENYGTILPFLLPPLSLARFLPNSRPPLPLSHAYTNTHTHPPTILPCRP